MTRGWHTRHQRWPPSRLSGFGSTAQPGPLRWGALTFGVSMIFLATSAYHTGRWTDATAILRLIDHRMIFVFLGGTYTPFLSPARETSTTGSCRSSGS